MANPPAIVKLALESICLLLGENASDWKSIRAVIMRDNFINTVVSNFNTEDIRYACDAFYYYDSISLSILSFRVYCLSSSTFTTHLGP